MSRRQFQRHAGEVFGDFGKRQGFLADGRGDYPCIEHLVAIANATGVSCDWLTSGNGQPCTATCDASRSPVMAQNCTERQVLLAFRNNPSRMRKEVLRLLDIQVAASAS